MSGQNVDALIKQKRIKLTKERRASRAIVKDKSRKEIVRRESSDIDLDRLDESQVHLPTLAHRRV